MSNKTLCCYNGRDERNRNSDKCFPCYNDRLPRTNNNSYDGRISLEVLELAGLEKQLKKPWILTQKYTLEYQKITINLNNKKQDIKKDTQPESDKRVRHEDELLDSNYYKIIIPDGHKYTKGRIIYNLLNHVASDTLVPINTGRMEMRPILLWTIKE